MDINSMTLGEFIEFSDIYEYSQDHYDISKAFMEMDLIKMHLESYQFLLESKDISENSINSPNVIEFISIIYFSLKLNLMMKQD